MGIHQSSSIPVILPKPPFPPYLKIDGPFSVTYSLTTSSSSWVLQGHNGRSSHDSHFEPEQLARYPILNLIMSRFRSSRARPNKVILHELHAIEMTLKAAYICIETQCCVQALEQSIQGEEVLSVAVITRDNLYLLFFYTKKS